MEPEIQKKISFMHQPFKPQSCGEKYQFWNVLKQLSLDLIKSSTKQTPYVINQPISTILFVCFWCFPSIKSWDFINGIQKFKFSENI